MFRLAICDDETTSLSLILSLMDEYCKISPFHIEYTGFHSSWELASALEQGKSFDIYCLDIVMPGFDGIQLGKEIRSYDKATQILYLTSSPEFALDSYSVKAANYLLKPITKETLFSALDDLLEQMKKQEEHSITVKDNQGLHKIMLFNLVYVEAMGRKVVYHLVSGRTLECTSQFSKVCNTLLEYHFFLKPHRSYLVNMNYINTIENTEITLQIPVSIPIAQGKSKQIKEHYLAFQMERN